MYNLRKTEYNFNLTESKQETTPNFKKKMAKRDYLRLEFF